MTKSYLRILMSFALVTAVACGEEKAETVAPVEAAPAEPELAQASEELTDDPVVIENRADLDKIAELNGTLKVVADQPLPKIKAAHDAGTAFSTLCTEKAIKDKNINKMVGTSLGTGKAKTFGVKKADRAAFKEVLSTLIATTTELKTSKQEIADTNALIDSMVAEAKTLSDGIIARGAEHRPAAETVQLAKDNLATLEKNATTAKEIVGEHDKSADDAANWFGVKFDEVKAAEAAPAEGDEAAPAEAAPAEAAAN